MSLSWGCYSVMITVESRIHKLTESVSIRGVSESGVSLCLRCHRVRYVIESRVPVRQMCLGVRGVCKSGMSVSQGVCESGCL
jgi:hypothetical protein